METFAVINDNSCFDFGTEVRGESSFFEKYGKNISFDKDTIYSRQEMLRDMEREPSLAELLRRMVMCFDAYDSIMHTAAADAHAHNTEKSIQALVYPKLCIELVDSICDSLENAGAGSRFFCELYAMASSDRKSEHFRKMQKHYLNQNAVYANLKSITIGMNLTPSFEPKEAGVIGLNCEEYKSGDLLDRILKMDFVRDEYHCIAPLTTIDEKLGFRESQQINYAVLKALALVYKSSIAWCGSGMRRYLSKTLKEYRKHADSVRFALAAWDEMTALKKCGLPLVYPSVSEDGRCGIGELYDAVLCRTNDRSDVVPNSFVWETSVNTYILTGRNSGGKSVFLRSVAFAWFYFQLGMPIPARSAVLPIVDRLYKISAEKNKGTSGGGRFEAECRRLSEAVQNMGADSLVLVDEAFTSTSPEDATAIAANFITKVCGKGAKCIFVTHYRTLPHTSAIVQLGSKVGYIHTSHNGYKITAGLESADSTAKRIAGKYGLG